METREQDPPLPSDAPPEPPADQPVKDLKWYYRLNALAAAALSVLLFCLVWRPAAWFGLSMCVVILGALFFYHYFSHARLDFLEFIVMIVVLGQVTGLTTSVLWPKLRETNQDWMILAVWIMEAAFILTGTLWANWVSRMTGLTRRRQRFYVMLIGWLAGPSAPGILMCAALTLAGVPTWVLARLEEQEESVFSWHVFLAPLGVIIAFFVLRSAWILHNTARAAERAAQDAEEKIELPRSLTMDLKQSASPETLDFEKEEDSPLDSGDEEHSPRRHGDTE